MKKVHWVLGSGLVVLAVASIPLLALGQNRGITQRVSPPPRAFHPAPAWQHQALHHQQALMQRMHHLQMARHHLNHQQQVARRNLRHERALALRSRTRQPRSPGHVKMKHVDMVRMNQPQSLPLVTPPAVRGLQHQLFPTMLMPPAPMQGFRRTVVKDVVKLPKPSTTVPGVSIPMPGLAVSERMAGNVTPAFGTDTAIARAGGTPPMTLPYLKPHHHWHLQPVYDSLGRLAEVLLVRNDGKTMVVYANNWLLNHSFKL